MLHNRLTMRIFGNQHTCWDHKGGNFMRKYLDSNVIYSTKDMTKKEWILKRKEGIGGSDVASILGISPYKSSVSVYLDKTSDELETYTLDNYKVEIGEKLEDFVAKEFTLRTNKKVRNVNGILKNEKYPYSIANIDKAVVGERAFLECVVTNSFNKKKIVELKDRQKVLEKEIEDCKQSLLDKESEIDEITLVIKAAKDMKN